MLKEIPVQPIGTSLTVSFAYDGKQAGYLPGDIVTVDKYFTLGKAGGFYCTEGEMWCWYEVVLPQGMPQAGLIPFPTRRKKNV